MGLLASKSATDKREGLADSDYELYFVVFPSGQLSASCHMAAAIINCNIPILIFSPFISVMGKLISFTVLAFCTFFLQIIHFPFAFSLQGGNETDKLSLLAFKSQITDDPFGVLSSWNDSLHFCNWSGVKCGFRHRRVVELDLHSSNLRGSLSPHLGNLSFLRSINLKNNSLSQNIPQELGNLFRLQTLALGNNTFSGEIPVNISLCSNLQILELQGNNLKGKFPAELGLLSKLQVFNFRKNNLVGEIPHSFGNLSSIEIISGAYNNLQGSIPSSIGKLKRLTYFALGVNNLSGTIPPSIFNISSLVVFGLTYNQVHGTLPHDLFTTLPNLETFNVGANLFSGSIPSSISNASYLLDLELSVNNFTGKVPIMESSPNLQVFYVDKNFLGYGEDDDLAFLYSLANKTSLELLSISDNNLGGVMPQIICNFTNLRQMVFGANRIRGIIPTEFGNLINLEAVGLELNQLTGPIPSSIGKLQNLVILYLGGNQITGSIPSSLGNASSMAQLSLNQNGLQGSIPPSLGNYQNLAFLDLSRNNLSGSIPKEVISISSLSMYLYLQENQLTGSLPSEVGKLVEVGFLDISNNMLSGEIPASLGSCRSMESLHLEGNLFHGTIPQSLSSLRSLKDLNLSHNNLTGQIPKFLGEFKLLESLDLSFNGFEGEVPVQGVFKNESAVSITGNSKLCGGIPQFNLSKCSSNEPKRRKPFSILFLVLIVACVCIGAILTTCVLFLYCQRRRRRRTATRSKAASDSSSSKNFFWRVTYEELLQATDRFSSSNLVGVGGFGSVYKGILASDGTIICVKVLNLLHEGACKSFMAECRTLANIRHRNLLKLLTACSSIDHQGSDFKALVYEFMINGSLEEWLHPNHTVDEESKPTELNLVQRLNVAIDVASALDYLHHHCQTPVVHCDLKPSNVLLDGDMVAHVGDFGLARFLGEAPHQLSSNQISSIGVKGTIGYAAPEYGMGSQVSTYGDVYSYGILLLQLFTGKRPTDSMFTNGTNLHNFVKLALPDHVEEVVDPPLLQEQNETGGIAFAKMNQVGNQKNQESLIDILKVGVACSAELPRNRMKITAALAELHRIRELLVPAGMLRYDKLTNQSEGPLFLGDSF